LSYPRRLKWLRSQESNLEPRVMSPRRAASPPRKITHWLKFRLPYLAVKQPVAKP